VHTHIIFFWSIDLAKSENFSSPDDAFLNSDWQEVIKEQNSKKLTLPSLSASIAENKESKSFFDRCPAFSVDTNARSSSFSICPLATFSIISDFLDIKYKTKKEHRFVLLVAR